jgi:hypothetical protein
MVLPASGSLSFSQIQTEFGSSFKQGSLLYGIASGIAISGAFSLSALRGKSASVPSVSTVSNQSVDTSSTSQNKTLTLSTYVTDTYGAPLIYTLSTYDNTKVSTASVSGSVLSYSVALNKFANTSNIVCVVTNRFSKTANISVPLFITGYNIAVSSMGSMNLTNTSDSRTLSSYFTDYSGTGLSYSFTSNPYSSASISAGTLSVVGNNRNTSYTVTVQASNSYSQTASSSVSVTETSSDTYSLKTYASVTGGVTAPFSDSCTTIVTSSGQSSYDYLPVVTYGGYNWLLQHSFGSSGRWSGLQLRNWSSGITVSQNYSLPTSASQVYTDWTAQYTGTYGVGGYKDNTTLGVNNLYNGGAVSNQAASSMMFYIPSWVKQICLVVADYYRSNPANTYYFSTNGSSWSNIGTASARGTNYGNGAIPQNPSTDADMIIYNPGGAGYLLVVEGGYTIASVAFVLLKP